MKNKTNWINSVSSLLIIISFILAPLTVGAGAWTQTEGDVFFRTSSKYYQASHIFNANGDRISGDWWDESGDFSEFSLQVLLEYGLTDELTFTAESVIKSMSSDYSSMLTDNRMVTGLSDVIVGLRYGLWRGMTVASVDVRAEIPTTYTAYTEQVRLGNGNLNGQARFLLGGGLPLGFGNYFDASFGYRVRGGPYDNDLLTSLSIGAETFSGLWLRTGASGVFNLGESADLANNNLDASYLGVGGALTYLFESGLGLEIAASTDVWGKNTFSGWGMELVVQYRTKSGA